MQNSSKEEEEEGKKVNFQKPQSCARGRIDFMKLKWDFVSACGRAKLFLFNWNLQLNLDFFSSSVFLFCAVANDEDISS